jgi:hypothetical protein
LVGAARQRQCEIVLAGPTRGQVQHGRAVAVRGVDVKAEPLIVLEQRYRCGIAGERPGTIW